MERRIQKIIFLSITISLITAGLLGAQEVMQDEQLRIQMWAELDAYPGLVVSGASDFTDNGGQPLEKKDASESKNMFSVAVSRLKEVAPFLMGGMINGWKFDYTPSDKMRSVSEFFSCEEVIPFNKQINPLSYKKTEVIEDKLYCWVYCDRTPAQQMSFEAWNSITHPKIHGVGQGPVEDGFDGIKTACENALKEAVRAYWRTMIKNKPKEIQGTVILIHNPRIYIKEGRYTVDLDFFMETDRIIPYSYY